MKKAKGRTVTLDPRTVERILMLGKMGESYDAVINRLIDEIESSRSTRVIVGRKRVLSDVFGRRLAATHVNYSISPDDLIESYKPFIPILKTTIEQRKGSSKIITTVNKNLLHIVNDLANAGAEIRHVEDVRRYIIYDNEVAYFSILPKPLVKGVERNRIEDVEGFDMWTRSTESAVIRVIKELFFEEWKKGITLSERVKQLGNCVRC